MNKVSYKRFNWQQDALSSNVKDKKKLMHTPPNSDNGFLHAKEVGVSSASPLQLLESLCQHGNVQHHWQKTQQTNKTKTPSFCGTFRGFHYRLLSHHFSTHPLGLLPHNTPEMLPLHPHTVTSSHLTDLRRLPPRRLHQQHFGEKVF